MDSTKSFSTATIKSQFLPRFLSFTAISFLPMSSIQHHLHSSVCYFQWLPIAHVDLCVLSNMASEWSKAHYYQCPQFFPGVHSNRIENISPVVFQEAKTRHLMFPTYESRKRIWKLIGIAALEILHFPSPPSFSLSISSVFSSVFFIALVNT